jgi:hypothetical protein
LGTGVQGDVADLVAFAVDAEVGYASAGLDVLDSEPAQFLAAETVIEERGEGRSVAKALETFVVGRLRSWRASLSAIAGVLPS